MRATKFDSGKPRVDLLPEDAVLLVADVLSFGAKKYGDRNWEMGLPWSRMYAAALRHLLYYWNGKNTDEESGKLHLAHAATCVLMLLAYQNRDTGKDDRPSNTIQLEFDL